MRKLTDAEAHEMMNRETPEDERDSDYWARKNGAAEEAARREEMGKMRARGDREQRELQAVKMPRK